ncbi:SMI1/KNR4 family protein [Caulobacter endophyticus]|uniref:SMI1/KNR4 family protein n=1 Tax=Caulobacter endophyticus TaxID=2172652 RepID=A0A2T9JLN2_9CAUL|nr:SMI1/KNR4 family protein [Caulobacter endophyticus]PVM84601.1 SMI1/KNR4 family protein [Caulobacter endophyticus]
MWPEIIAQLASTPEVLASLNPPASTREIDALERRVGARLPDSFKAYLATMDGQNDLGETAWLVEYNRFLPVAEIIETMDTMKALFAGEGRIAHIAENRIRPVLWDRRWIPFAGFMGSNHLVLDLHPGRKGVAGQIFQSFPGVDLEDDATVIADSFTDFSRDLLATLQARS